jgi:hypothetical protein
MGAPSAATAVARWRRIRIIVVDLAVAFELPEKGHDRVSVCCRSPFRCTL